MATSTQPQPQPHPQPMSVVIASPPRIDVTGLDSMDSSNYNSHTNDNCRDCDRGISVSVKEASSSRPPQPPPLPPTPTETVSDDEGDGWRRNPYFDNNSSSSNSNSNSNSHMRDNSGGTTVHADTPRPPPQPEQQAQAVGRLGGGGQRRRARLNHFDIGAAIRRDISRTVDDLDTMVLQLETRVSLLTTRLMRMQAADYTDELYQTPTFKASSKTLFEDQIAEYAEISQKLNPVVSRLNRLKAMHLSLQQLDTVSRRVTDLAQSMAHKPSQKKNLGTLIENMRGLFADENDFNDELEDDEPSYYIVAGSYGLTNASIGDVGLRDFQELEDVGLATVGDLRAAAITSADVLRDYIALPDNQAALDAARAARATQIGRRR